MRKLRQPLKKIETTIYVGQFYALPKHKRAEWIRDAIQMKLDTQKLTPWVRDGLRRLFKEEMQHVYGHPQAAYNLLIRASMEGMTATYEHCEEVVEDYYREQNALEVMKE